MPLASLTLSQLLLLLLLFTATLCNGLSIKNSSQHCKVTQFEYEEHDEASIRDCYFSPSTWHLIHSWCRNLPENRQSPIELNLTECRQEQQQDGDLREFWLSDDWYSPQKFIVYNNGLTLKAKPVINNNSSNNSSPQLKLIGFGLSGQHNVVQLHLHWGSNASMLLNGSGSEHRLLAADAAAASGERRLPTPAEVHIVTARDGMQFSKAAVTRDAIAVLGAFFEIDRNASSEAGKQSKSETAMRILLQDLKRLQTPQKDAKDAVTVELTLRDLLPQSLRRMLAYDGSLTTPHCNPVVQWRLFPDAMPVHASVLTKLTSLYYDKDHQKPMVNNFRPLMQKHNRKVRCTFNGNAL